MERSLKSIFSGSFILEANESKSDVLGINCQVFTSCVYTGAISYRPQRKLLEGKVFTGVCLST